MLLYTETAELLIVLQKFVSITSLSLLVTIIIQMEQEYTLVYAAATKLRIVPMPPATA
jgi:hypothetical protein